ncbi:MAG: DUF4911 domain-containing protein [Nitrospiraceae bacterium]|nr:DUF4911 domain-containing protein [Nitrospiraceae bacterium]
MDRLKKIQLRIDPKAVYFLHFVLEGYDNMFVLSTVDRHIGLVEVQATEGSIEDLSLILGSLEAEIGAVALGLDCTDLVFSD